VHALWTARADNPATSPQGAAAGGEGPSKNELKKMEKKEKKKAAKAEAKSESKADPTPSAPAPAAPPTSTAAPAASAAPSGEASNRVVFYPSDCAEVTHKVRPAPCAHLNQAPASQQLGTTSSLEMALACIHHIVGSGAGPDGGLISRLEAVRRCGAGAGDGACPWPAYTISWARVPARMVV
jgi:hypothetical protein